MYGNRSDYTSKTQTIPTWYNHIGRGVFGEYIINQESNMSSKNYYYGDSIEWDSTTRKYLLKNIDGSEVTQLPWKSVKNGMYTCANKFESSSCSSSVQYIVDSSANMMSITLINGETLKEANTVLYYGENIVYENGIYTIQNPIRGNIINYYEESEKYKGKYVCPAGEISCSTIWYIPQDIRSSLTIYYVKMMDGETYDNLYEEALGKKWIYGNDVEWDGSKYTLKDTYESSPINWKNDYKTIATRYHYTCFSTENSCTEVGYITEFDDSSGIEHLKLKNGKTIEDAKQEMFTNTTDSTIKQTIDKWYQANMLEYTDKLEDTVWCNDRSIYSGPLKSKDEDASSNNYTKFGANGRESSPSVNCPREEDRFTVSSEKGNGMLTYPTSVLTVDEIILAGSVYYYPNSGWSPYKYLYTDIRNFSLSPSSFNNTADLFLLNYDANISSWSSSYSDSGIRPAISLAPNSIIASGDGTATNPFTVDMDY